MNAKKDAFIDELKPRLLIFGILSKQLYLLAKLAPPEETNQTSQIFNFLLGCLYKSQNITEYCKNNKIEPPPPPAEPFSAKFAKMFACGAKRPKHDFSNESAYWEAFKVRRNFC